MKLTPEQLAITHSSGNIKVNLQNKKWTFVAMPFVGNLVITCANYL